jgi:hypothetical protein
MIYSSKYLSNKIKYTPYLHDDELMQKQNNAFFFTILSKQTLSQKKKRSGYSFYTVHVERQDL